MGSTTTTTTVTLPAPPATDVSGAADREALLKHHAFRGYQFASIILPPVYLVGSLVRRRPIRANRMLETSWLTGLGGAVGGAGIGYVQYRNVDAAKIAEMRRIAEYDSRQVRLDDYAIIGGVLGALLTPAVLYSRARLVHLILGGATWGVGVGAGTHWYDLLSTSERMF